MKKSSKKIHEKGLNSLKEQLEEIDTQIKENNYTGNIERITKLWEIRKGIVNDIRGELDKGELYKGEKSFLKEEFERIDNQIKPNKYGGPKENLDKVKELFKLKKIIMEEIKIIEAEGPQVRWIKYEKEED